MPSANEIIKRNNVNVLGTGDKTLFLAHGFGCDQNMWRFMLPGLIPHYKVVLFDYVGSGNSDLSHYDHRRYSALEGYAQDILEICEALNLQNITFVGHSVSNMIGLIASIQQPSFFSRLVMVCPSPCFLNFKPDYLGGFEKDDLEELFDLMDKNYIGWANYLAPLVMGTTNSDELIGELSGSFCSTDPVIAKSFAEATFLSDYRYLLKEITQPCLILQSENDALAATSVGEFIASEIAHSELNIIPAHGHCLHMTHPEAILKSIMKFAK